MRRTVIAAVFACLAVFGSFVGAADARPGQDKTNIYYSDASFTEPVGEELVLNCYRAVHMLIWGVRSRYYMVESSSCSEGDGGVGSAPRQCFVDGNFSVPCP